jgi:hypothetical protein
MADGVDCILGLLGGTMKAEEFYSIFESGFGPGAAAAGLTRSRGKALKWKYQATDGTALTVGFRLNRKNLVGYPGEFMPDIFWSGPRSGPRDTGEISYYQYSSPSETGAVARLEKQVIKKFIAENQLEAQLSDPASLIRLMADKCELQIRPNHQRWLPYWEAEDAAAWGGLFGGTMGGWIPRFFENPETLEAWCWRVLWSKPSTEP